MQQTHTLSHTPELIKEKVRERMCSNIKLEQLVEIFNRSSAQCRKDLKFSFKQKILTATAILDNN